MATFTLKGSEHHTSTPFAQKNQIIPSVTVTDKDLNDLPILNVKTDYLLINAFPSVDTAVCALVFKHLAKESFSEKITLVNLSADIPFALQRFCTENALSQSINLSSFRSEIGSVLGIQISTGPLKGLLARSIFLIDVKNAKIVYSQLVPEITSEPNYQELIQVIKNEIK